MQKIQPTHSHFTFACPRFIAASACRWPLVERRDGNPGYQRTGPPVRGYSLGCGRGEGDRVSAPAGFKTADCLSRRAEWAVLSGTVLADGDGREEITPPNRPQFAERR